MKKHFIIQIMIISLLLCGCVQEKVSQIYTTQQKDDADTTEDSVKVVSEEALEVRERIVVYVCGAVVTPGLYELEAGARAGHAIDLAGGMTEDALTDGINLARLLSDGEQVRVPYEGETVADAAEISDASNPGKVNLNTATVEQLMTLPGIGQSKAESILKFRETKGKFSSVDEIMQIEGIKEGVFNKIKDDICVK